MSSHFTHRPAHWWALSFLVVFLTVPPKVLIQTGNQAVSISERVQLDCPVVGGDPPPQIIWTKNDRPVEIGGRIQQLANGSLAIYDSGVSIHLLSSLGAQPLIA